MSLLLAYGLMGVPITQAQAPTPVETLGNPVIYHLVLDDALVSPITAEYIQSGLEEAAAQQARGVLIQLDTPGGLLSSTHTIVKTIMNAPVPVIVYVAPTGARAGSAGVFLTLAAHVAAMAPGTRIGAAHPVTMGGTWPGSPQQDGELGAENPSDTEVMGEKILQDTLAQIRALAKLRGRNQEWAVRAVSESRSLTDEEAVRYGLVDFGAPNIPAVLEKADGRSVLLQGRLVTLDLKQTRLVSYPFSFRQQVLSVLTHPVLAYLFLMLAFYGILSEITNPGLGVGGLLGFIFLVLALIGLQALSINMAGLGLILVGFGLFVAEVFTAGFGILFGAGLVSLLLGTLMLYQTGEPYLINMIPSILGLAVGVGIITVFLLRKVMRAYRIPAEDANQKLISQVGRVTQAIQPNQPGKVKVYGEVWNALSESGEPIEVGETIRVVGMGEGTPWVLHVEKVNE